MDFRPRQSAPVRRQAKAPMRDGVVLQGCSALKWIKCGAVAAGCVGLSGPAFIACIAGVAADCVECFT